MASEDKEISDLERLIAEEKADKARQNEIIDGSAKKTKRRKVAAISTVATLSVALIGGVILYDPFAQSFRFGLGSTAQVEGGYTGGGGNNAPIAAADPFGWAKETGNVFPIPTKPWEESSYLAQTQADVEERSTKYWGTDLRQAAMQLPSEEAGFTADDSLSFNEDGSLNPLYSYWTQEVFYNETTNLLERLLNPVYGSWATYQYSESMGNAEEVLPTIFSDVMTPEALAGGGRAVPVLADWEGNDFGLAGTLLDYSEGNRWLGEVTGYNTTFEFNDELNQYEVILVANVTYSAWTKSKDTVTKEGILTLNLGSNVDKTVDSENKVIVNSATLELK